MILIEETRRKEEKDDNCRGEYKERGESRRGEEEGDKCSRGEEETEESRRGKEEEREENSRGKEEKSEESRSEAEWVEGGGAWRKSWDSRDCCHCWELSQNPAIVI